MCWLPQSCVPSHCVNGTCGAQTLYPGACVTEWVVDATNLYWTCSSSGTVMSAPKDGSGPVTTLASGQASPDGIAVDATQLYWTNSGDGTVMATPLAASGLTTLASGLTGISQGDLIHVGGGYAWVMAGRSLVQIPVGGGPAVTAWTNTVLSGGTSYTALAGLTVDASNVFWSTRTTDYAGGLVYTMPLAGGAPTELSDFSNSFQEWDRLVPWAGAFQGLAFDELDLPGAYYGEAPTLGANYLSSSLDGATDGSTLYWTNGWCSHEWVVKKAGLPNGSCPAGDGPLVDLPAYRVAVDDTYLYLWANGTILRTFK
jgi:hypothetical protein